MTNRASMMIHVGAVFAVLPALFAGPAPAAAPSNSKLSIHLDGPYTGGAQAVINAHPRVIKIFFRCVCVDGGQLQAAQDYKNGTPAGKVVLRIYTAQRFSLSDNPTASANSYWDNSLAPAINNMSAAQKALIDYLEGPNEYDSTPAFENLASAQWFNTFWLQLAQLIADNSGGMHPMMGSIAVGNPAGTGMSDMFAMIDAIVPSLRKCKQLGGGWSYHDYSGPAMTKDLNTEIWYSLRYRQYYDHFRTYYPDLNDLPLVGSEGGGFNGWTQVGAGYFEDWLVWHDQQIRQDSYFIGDTLFEIGDPGGWGTFDLEPIAGWLAGYVASAAPSTPPSPPTGLTATAGDAQVSLGWNPASGAASYNVKRSNTSGGGYSTIASNVTATSYSNTGLTNGTTYYYVVSAVNSFGESGNSSQVSATPAAGSMNGNTPAGTNLATSTAQWSSDSDYSPSFNGAKAIDGIVSASSKWTSSAGTPPHWLALDLGGNKTVNGFIVRHAGAGGEETYYNTKNFGLQSAASMSGPWADECVVDNSAQANVTTRSYNTPKALRYVRLYVTNAGIDNYARIPEFEVWGSTSTPVSPTINRSPSSLSPSCVRGSDATSQTFSIQNTGLGTLNYSISVNQPWLSVAPVSGTSTGETDIIAVNYATGSLSAGTYNATILISDPNATNTPQTIAVTLIVAPSHVPGDFDGDNDVDEADFGHLQACLTGPGIPVVEAGCLSASLDGDPDADAQDMDLFLRCFTGSGTAGSPDCVP
jgi:hypothetical protein